MSRAADALRNGQNHFLVSRISSETAAKPRERSLYARRTSYEGKAQIRKLMPEVQCHVTATALWNEAMQWVHARTSLLGPPQGFDIPKTRMRFVEGYIGTECKAQADKMPGHALLIEEEIKGRFVKYINNNSPVQLEERMRGPEEAVRAEFLAFIQHVQYWMTRGYAFCTDFQGAQSEPV